MATKVFLISSILAMLVTTGLGDLQSFDTPSGRIEFDAGLSSLALTEDIAYTAGCFKDYCNYCFYGPDKYGNVGWVLTISIWSRPSDDRTFEELVDEEYATESGEWMTRNDGRKVYFERNPADGVPMAVVDFLDETGEVYIWGSIYTDPDLVLDVSRSIKLNSR